MTEEDPTYEPRIPAPEGAADRVREGVLDEALRIAGDTWDDDLSPAELGVDAPPEKPKRGRGRRQAPNPDTHVEVPTEQQEERAEQAIMELGIYEGRQVDRREVRFSGSAGMSAYHPEGVESWHKMRAGARVALTVVGTIGSHGHRFTIDKDGNVIEVIAVRNLKIDVVQLRALASDVEGLPMFEDGERNDAD